MIRVLGLLAVVVFLHAPSMAVAEDFASIMSSIAKAGSVPNGDGHHWKFRSAGGGKWEVEGARGEVAQVLAAGENKVEIRGFPRNWNANGVFKFSRTPSGCVLDSDHSQHKLQWTC